MNKLFLVAILAGVFTTSAMASMSYECWRYVNGTPQGYVSVSANNKSEAYSKALKKFKYVGKPYDYIKCK